MIGKFSMRRLFRWRAILFVSLGALTLIVTIVLLKPHYRYGVNIRNSDTIIQPYFSSQFSKDYDFHTVLFLRDGYKAKGPMAVDQAYSLIYIEHMVPSNHHPDDETAQAGEKVHVSLLRFGKHTASKEDRHSIELNRISLKHLDPNKGKIDQYLTDLNAKFQKLKTCMKSDKTSCVLAIFYMDSDLPDKIIEEIDIEFSYKGRQLHIQKTYIIERKPYDNLMGRLFSALMAI